VHGTGGVVGGPCHVKVHGGEDVVAKGVRGVSAIVQLWGWVSHGRVGDRCLEARQQSDEDKIDHCGLCVMRETACLFTCGYVWVCGVRVMRFGGKEVEILYGLCRRCMHTYSLCQWVLSVHSVRCG
jgi:hypothetical protein